MRQYSEVLNASNSNTHTDFGNGRNQPVCLGLFLASTFQEMLIYTRGNLFPLWFISSYFSNKVFFPPLTSTSLDVLLVVCPCNKVNWAKPRGEDSFKCLLERKKTIHKKKGNTVILEIVCCGKKKHREKDSFGIQREHKSQNSYQHRRTEVQTPGG